ncbi:dihydrolipoamide acetyltransferase family protein [Leifsonia naganoensis]|uniref:Dihydrolipoamide acetyltransferase component of pyruvate dehydrogenase complex n=1 Tax=Leifsonia naganoensis TaxID=150025 RepID=A0A853DPI6_9MICO|nr:dihydrolipoamide acetyltransferase family protein [Leifsonia naganoensis]NYK10976.1 pyruvate dehydrogenase E2 component (dihydrolipoamide acetyltransferase) [Leifsonia naganoensis]
MTARVFALPDLGEGLTDAELVRWLVARGDTVVVDQPIAEVETAKSVVEVPSPFAGVVAALHGEEGETIAVGAPLLEVEEAGDPTPAPEAAVPSGGSGQVLVGYGTTVVTGGRRARVSVAATATLAPPAPTAPGAPASPRIVPVVSPVVRALARSHGVDLTTLRASGDGGVVTRADVEAAFAAPSLPRTSADPGADPGTDPRTDSRTGLTVRAIEPFSRFRRTVAETMSRSRAEIPEATVWVDVDATDLWNGRRRLRFDGRTPSLLSFIARFALAALARRPELASRVTADGGGLEFFDGVNLGVAVDTPRGLVVPAVRRADLLSVRQLDGELDRIARAARDGSLGPAELTGSTFTINNYGSLGVDGSAAIINHPEVAILGVGRMIERPWVVDGAIVPRRIAQLSLVFDHRVTDGGVAAGFLRDIADAIESPLGVLADAPPPGAPAPGIG